MCQVHKVTANNALHPTATAALSGSLVLRLSAAGEGERLYARGYEYVSEKYAQLLQLARRRQLSRWESYNCIGDYHRGVYECDFVSPYTRSAGNVDAALMVFLQDWASDDVLSGLVLPARFTVGHDPRRRTNQRLCELLRQHFGLALEEVYATNVFPFVKAGSVSASIRKQDLVRAAREFALPQIKIVRPRLAVCLGKAAFSAVEIAANRRGAKSLADAIASPFELGETQVWCQAHTGQQGTNYRNRNGVDRVTRDWACMAQAYNNRLKTDLRNARWPSSAQP
jgi:restriction system protein